MPRRTVRGDAGFTLVEVLIATAIFVVVAFAGLETLRGLGAVTTQLAARADASAALATALARLRADAASSIAVWVPSSTCNATAVALLRRDAGGQTFGAYLLQGTTLVHASAAGPIDPCDRSLRLDTVLTGVSAMSVTAFAADTLAQHVDPVSGNPDGGLIRNGIPSVAVDTHARDHDGTPIVSGNGVVEVGIDADPALATIDLLAGDRPNGYALVLTYACGPRCAANQSGNFPELRTLDVTTCDALAPDLPDSSDFYVPNATGLDGAGRIVTTQYLVRLRYGFTFAGGTSPALTVYRAGPAFAWPAAANLADAYPVDYTNNTVKTTGAAALAALFGPPATLATASAVCGAMNGESDFRG